MILVPAEAAGNTKNAVLEKIYPCDDKGCLLKMMFVVCGFPKRWIMQTRKDRANTLNKTFVGFRSSTQPTQLKFLLLQKFY